MYGYTGAILRIDLTDRKASVIDTKDYEQSGGGHGIGTALFWDLCKDKTVSGFDSGNVVTMMTSPFAGAPVPTGGSRMEVQGIAVEGYPFEWFTRSNFGGRFAAMLKYAGWDGIVIEGRADKPVWIDIRDRTRSGDLGVTIRDASSLWGLTTCGTQKKIWQEVCTDGGCANSALKPAVVAIGPAGENMIRYAALIHDAGNAAGQGGFGGVFGSKNLKAISVVGTGSVKVADPGALMELRMHKDVVKKFKHPDMNLFWPVPKDFRPAGCWGCSYCDRGRYSKFGNESQCAETLWSGLFDEKDGRKDPDVLYMGADLIQKMGVNAYHIWKGYLYLSELSKRGILGKGKEIDCDLPFEKRTSIEFAEQLVHLISYREGVGDILAEGFPRAAEKWNRKEDFGNGFLSFPYWGYACHGYDPRTDIIWGASSILSERDCNEHAFNDLFWAGTWSLNHGQKPDVPAGLLAKAFTSKMHPYAGDERMVDYSEENMYSEHLAKAVAWQKDYTRFWKHSILICDQRWPNLGSPNAFQLEPAFWRAVTGKEMDFAEGMALGRKIWNLDNAIWALQGRHRDNVHFADYIYKVPYSKDTIKGVFGRIDTTGWSYYLPGIKNGKWDYIATEDRCLDRQKFEELKTHIYRLWDWDPATGWPKRSALEAQGLKAVADELEEHGKLGSEERTLAEEEVA